MANFIVMGTWNTKKEELEFVCQEIKKRSSRLQDGLVILSNRQIPKSDLFDPSSGLVLSGREGEGIP
jgi:hypothetical protein